MKRRLVLSYVAVAALIMIVLEVPLGIVYSRHELSLTTAGLQRDAAAIAVLAEDGVEHHDTAALASLAAQYRVPGQSDVEIVGIGGIVLVPARSDEGELATGSVHGRVIGLLTRGTSNTGPLGDGDELFAMARVGAGIPPLAVVVVVGPTARVDGRIRAAWLALAALALCTIAGAMGLGLLVARSVTGPLTGLEDAARRLGSGDLKARAKITGPEELQALGRAFNDMAGRLSDLVAAQHAFVADASHQLRSPLTALRLRLENLAAASTQTGSGAAAAAAAAGAGAGADTAGDTGELDAILGEMDRLSRLVDGLLVLAGAEGRRPAREVVDVGAIVAERRDAWAALAEEGGVTLVWEASDRPVGAWFVGGHLEQILDNLLANALEASGSGQHVRLRVRGDGHRVEVHVEDEGRGMAAEEREHAFDRLWRGAHSKPGSGSGLGLAIVRQLARANDAEVELREAPKGGVDAVIRAEPARMAARSSGSGLVG
ncbi:MAG: ATP-binding protein [Acidimicrobiales bacterium]